MIKYLKFLWKKCFGSMGDSRTKPVISIEPADGLNEEIILQPKPLHCTVHNRFNKSCVACAEAVK